MAQKRKFRYIRINGKVIQDPFDDEDMRQLFISFAEKVLGLKFTSGTKYGIDLVCVDDPSWVLKVLYKPPPLDDYIVR